MSSIKSLIPNLLTAGNLVGGILAIIFSLTDKLEWAPYCIFISAFLDFFDGFAARLLKVQSELGKQLDSLADMVTFGVAPGIIVFMMIKVSIFNSFVGLYMDYPGPYLNNPDTFTEITAIVTSAPEFKTDQFYNLMSYSTAYIYLPYIAFIIPILSLFRLAKFNLDTRQSESFIGLPTPANTLFFAVLPILLFTPSIKENTEKLWMIENIILNFWLLSVTAIMMSVMLVVELPLFALKFKTFGWKGNEIRYVFLTISIGLLATLVFWAIPLIIILYVLLSLIQNIVKK